MPKSKEPMNKASKEAMTKFKLECAEEIGRLQFCKEHNDDDKSNLTAKQNGSEGGPIGGQMVKKMIEQYKKQNNM